MSAIKNHEDRIAEYSFVPAIEDHVLEYVFEITELREALKGEQECNVRLDADWQRCMKEKSELQDHIYALTEALKVAQEENTANMSTCKGIISGLTTERDALVIDRDEWKEATILANQRFKTAEARLSAIEAQEPELWARYPRTGRNTPPEVVTKKPEDADSWVAFYAHPVAPAQPVNELVEALEHAVEIAEGKRDGTWDDLLQYRATIAHAKLDKLTALSEQADLYSEFTKAAQPLTKEQVEKVLGALVDADKYVSLDSVDEAIEIMKGVRT
jgi:hypothetical protein